MSAAITEPTTMAMSLSCGGNVLVPLRGSAGKEPGVGGGEGEDGEGEEGG